MQCKAFFGHDLYGNRKSWPLAPIFTAARDEHTFFLHCKQLYLFAFSSISALVNDSRAFSTLLACLISSDISNAASYVLESWLHSVHLTCVTYRRVRVGKVAPV